MYGTSNPTGSNIKEVCVRVHVETVDTDKNILRGCSRDFGLQFCSFHSLESSILVSFLASSNSQITARVFDRGCQVVVELMLLVELLSS